MGTVNLNILELILISILTWIVFKITDFIFLKTIKFDYKKLFAWMLGFKRTIFVIHLVIGFLGSAPAVYVVYSMILPMFPTDGPEPTPKFLVYYWLTIFHISCIGLYGMLAQTMFIESQKVEFNLVLGACLSLLASFISILFCFTAGFIMVPLLSLAGLMEMLKRIDVKVKFN